MINYFFQFISCFSSILSVNVLIKEKSEIAFKGYLIIKGNSLDRQIMTNWQTWLCPHAIILSVVCSLLSSWMSSWFPAVPLVRGMQFILKALLASNWDAADGWCCSSKIKLASPAICQTTHTLKQTRKQQQIKLNLTRTQPSALSNLWLCLYLHIHCPHL